MTLHDLKTAIESASWFSRLGEFQARPGIIPIRRIQSAGNFELLVDFDPDERDSAVEWEWLPSQNDQADPIHGDTLKELERQEGKLEELRATGFDAYKMTLASLRHMCQNPLLKVGPHDSTEAAKGGALFAMRHAAMEVIVGKQGFWYSLFPIYVAGHWPCGITKYGDLLVF